MRNQTFAELALVDFEAAYPQKSVVLSHHLLDHPLLTLEALEGLAATLPKDCIEYNNGKLPIGIRPEDVPAAKLSPVETIRTIADNGSWLVLKRIEQQPDYARLFDAILSELKPVAQPATGEMLACEAFVFVISQGSITPFHFDPEHNILLQIRGQKTMTLFAAEDEELLGPKVHESYHLGGHHRNLMWNEAYAARGRAITLRPGQALHVPVKAPHFVTNGPEVSISLSVTWRSDWTFAEADARSFNHILRKAGLNPRRPDAYPSRNLAKALAYRAIRRIHTPTPAKDV